MKAREYPSRMRTATIATVITAACLSLVFLRGWHSPDSRELPLAAPSAVQPLVEASEATSGVDIRIFQDAYTRTQKCVPDRELLTMRQKSRVQRGINLSGLEHTQQTLPGILGTTYFAPDQRDIAYFASQGFTAIRLPIAWERIQPKLNGKLDSRYARLIDAAIADAKVCNMVVILDLHNFGARRAKNGAEPHKVGSKQVPISAFSDVWNRMAHRWRAYPSVWGFDTMNEPGGMPYASGPRDGNATSTLTAMHRAAVKAIRAARSRQWIILETDQYSGLQNFVPYYGTNPKKWWADTLNRTILSGHYYFDQDHTGAYRTTWTPESRARIKGEVLPMLEWAKKNRIPILIGEFGVPARYGVTSPFNGADVMAWQKDLASFLTILDRYNASWTYWGGGIRLIDHSSIEPGGWLAEADWTKTWKLTTKVASFIPQHR